MIFYCWINVYTDLSFWKRFLTEVLSSAALRVALSEVATFIQFYIDLDKNKLQKMQDIKFNFSLVFSLVWTRDSFLLL